MNGIPNKCPLCGDDLFHSSSAHREFMCYTVVLPDKLIESWLCSRNQRDQLAVEVRRLKAMLADRDEASACAVIQG